MNWLFFWRKKQPTVDSLLMALPELVTYKDRTWGLRIKKERGKIYVRYVTAVFQPVHGKKYLKKTYESFGGGWSKVIAFRTLENA